VNLNQANGRTDLSGAEVLLGCVIKLHSVWPSDNAGFIAPRSGNPRNASALRDNSIGAIRALPGIGFNWFVNGGLTTDPAHVVLHNHDDIELFADAKGANIAPPPAFQWPNATR